MAGFIPTPESLAALLAAARLGDHDPRPPSDGRHREPTRRTNLPLPLTSFVGREHELAAVPDLLAQTRHALDRIAAGTYATCESTGLPIGKARLQAFPRATLSVEAKQREERR